MRRIPSPSYTVGMERKLHQHHRLTTLLLQDKSQLSMLKEKLRNLSQRLRANGSVSRSLGVQRTAAVFTITKFSLGFSDINIRFSNGTSSQLVSMTSVY
ncbi:hypothetical protein EYF80_057147 [Liparis tanakae]|uniref:Uncharacterized protein n=1 Tax=Liparis tanakae TaxID=230148 RepID=A0A4Z2EVW1_9TELE|nr:hypothetical protein EYF80_057147 [Liparis tanakae]